MLSGKALSLGPPFRVCGPKYMGFPHKPAQTRAEASRTRAEASRFAIDRQACACYNASAFCEALTRLRGEMAERLKALVLKTSDVERHRGFESLSLRHPRKARPGEVPKWPKGLPC